MRALGFLFLCIGLVPLSAVAQAPRVPPQLIAFINRPDQLKEIGAVQSKQWSMSFGECASVTTETNVQIAVLAPVEFDETGSLKHGAVKLAYHALGCGQEHQLNIIVGVDRDGALKRLSTIPGNTVADLVLQHDAIMYAFMGMAKIAPPGCKAVRVKDSRFVKFGAENPAAMAGRDKRSWSEVWTVDACGVVGLVTMHFTPDATGTSIMSQPDETRRLAP